MLVSKGPTDHDFTNMLEIREEKRKSTRVPLRVETFLVKDNQEYRGIALNLSDEGMLIVVNLKVFTKNESCEVVFNLPAGEQSIQIQARVVWTAALQGSTEPDFLMGLFLQISDSQKEQLKNFLQLEGNA